MALYLAADVMLVTALRDGMNLVAKEYVAARDDNTGALVLSEFTGAADQLKHALLVNPHDIDGLKAAIMRAVNIPAPRPAAGCAPCAGKSSTTTSTAGARTSSTTLAHKAVAMTAEPAQCTAELRRALLAARRHTRSLLRGAGLRRHHVPLGRPVPGTPARSLPRPPPWPPWRPAGTTTALVSGRALASLRPVAAPRTDTAGGQPRCRALARGPTPRRWQLDRATGGRAGTGPRRRRRATPVSGDGRWNKSRPASCCTTGGPQRPTRGRRRTRHEALAGQPGAAREHGQDGAGNLGRQGGQGREPELLRELTGATAVLFAGDDVTDEHAFAALPPATSASRWAPGNTAAAFRIGGPDELPAVLELLLVLDPPECHLRYP